MSRPAPDYYHEAAHALAALTLGGDVSGVRVWSGGRGGRTRIQGNMSTLSRLVVCAAGEAAERRLSPRMAMDHRQSGNFSHDEAIARRVLAGEWGGQPVDTAAGVHRLLSRAERQAGKLVSDRWREIDFIASYLEDCGYMDGRTLRLLAEDAMPRARPIRPVCYHEAAHALGALAIGDRVMHVIVRPDGTGVMRRETRPGKLRKDVAYDLAYVCALGPLADAKARGVRPSKIAMDAERCVHDIEDMHHALEYLVQQGCEPSLKSGLASTLQAAAGFVRRRWEDISRVAQALDRSGELSGDELLALLRDRRAA